MERAPKNLQAAVATLAETLTGVEGVEEAAIKVTIMASRLYLFGMQLLPLLHGFSDPSWWAEAIPGTSNKALRSWQAAPTSKSKMAKALAAMVAEKLETASGPSANDAAALFGRSSKKPVVASSSSEREKTKKKKTNKDKKKKRSSKSSSSSSEGKKKKKTQDKSKKENKRKAASSEDSEKAVSEDSRAEKKHQKDKKDKRDKKDRKDKEKKRRKPSSSEDSKKSASEATAPEKRNKTSKEEEKDNKDKKDNKERATTSEVRIRCINAVDADGHGIVKETDHVDTVEVTKEETLQQVLQRFLHTQGKGEDIKNWNIKLLTEGVLRTVDAGATPAHACGEAALVRKGG